MAEQDTWVSLRRRQESGISSEKIHALPVVQADQALLRLVLVNLISNAVKFTGGRNEAKIEIGCVPNGSAETVIFIRDNGRFRSELYQETVRRLPTPPQSRRV
jgi:C4-dicarboxylate-specific signal transduction histidine kinase